MPADVFAYASDGLGTPVTGVRFSLHAGDGSILQSDTTDVDGLAFLGNRAAGDYEIRVTPTTSYLAESPRTTAAVIDSADPLVFDHVVTPATLPQSADPNMCLCSGRFTYADGTPIRRSSIEFRLELSGPDLLVNAAGGAVGISKGRSFQCPVVDGYGQVLLPRGAVLHVSAPWIGESVHGWEIVVPDLPAASLPDVVMPVVRAVQWYADGVLILPLADPELPLAVGASKTITSKYLLRSGALVSGTVSAAGTAAFTVGADDDGLLELTGVAVATDYVEANPIGLQESVGGFNVRPAQAVLARKLRVVVT